jgi:GAF domain-containing protein/CheY-like chemotaxis protein
MSDLKKLNKRLKDLFADLEDEISRPLEEERQLIGWTWEIDSEGIYRNCSPEVEDIFGIQAQEFVGESITTFRLAAESQEVIAATLESKRPQSELTLRFLTAGNEIINALTLISYIPADNGIEERWRGFAQVLKEADPAPSTPPIPELPSREPESPASASSFSMPDGIAIEEDQVYSVSTPFSSIGGQSLALRQSLAQAASQDIQAAMAVPIDLEQQALGLLEIIDEDPNRHWSSEELRLVEEVAEQLSLALENARLFGAIQQRSRELSLINRIVAQVASSLDVNESLEFVTREVANALGVQVNIALVNPHGNSLTMVTDFSPRQENPFVVGYEIPITGNPSTEKVFETKEPVIIEDPQNNPLISSIHDLMRSLNVQSMGIFPMLIQDEIFGTVGVYVLEEGRELTRDEIQLVETVLVPAATAVQNARLFEQIQTRSTQLQTAAEISRAASSILEPNPLILQAVNLIQDRFNLYYAGIFLIDEDGSLTGEPNRWAVLRAGTGEAGRIQLEQGHKLEIGGESMIGQCVSTMQARISLLAPDEVHRFANPILPDTQSEMALPLISRAKAIGAMTIQSVEPNAFSEEDIAVLQTMADQVANALQNANLFTQTQQQLADISTIQETTSGLSAALTLDAVVNTLLIHLISAVSADSASVFTIDGSNLIRLGVYPREGEASLTVGDSISLEDYPLTQHVIDTRKPLSVAADDENLQEHAREAFKAAGIAVNATIPIVGPEGVIGTISLSRNLPATQFTEAELDLMTTLANQAGVAIENARSYEIIQQAANDMTMLFNASQTFRGEILEPREIARIVGRIFIEMLPGISRRDLSPECEISLYEPERNILRTLITVFLGDDRATIVEDQTPHEFYCQDFPATLRVLETLQPLVVHASNPDADPAELSFLEEEEIATNVCLPLAVKGEAIGMIEINSYEGRELHLTQDEINLAMTLANQAAVAIENARAYEQIQQAAEEMSTLFSVSRAISGASVEMDEIARVIARNFMDVLGIPECSVSIYDPVENTEKVVIDLYLDKNGKEQIREDEIGKVYPLKDYPNTTQVIETMQPAVMHASDPNIDSAELALMKEFDVTTTVLIPLVVKGQVVGLIELESLGEERHFTDEELTLTMTLANQAAVAVENARSYERIQQAAEEMAMLFDVSRTISGASIELKEIGRTVASIYVDVMDVPACSINLYDPDDDVAQVIIDYYIDEDGQEQIREEEIGKEYTIKDYPTTFKALQSKQPTVLYASDPAIDPAELAFMKKHNLTTSGVLPMVLKQQVIGYIELETTEEERHFTDNELNIAMTLANQAAVAIENARSYERIQQAANEMAMLFEVSQAISGAPIGVKEVADVVARNFVEVLSIPECSVSLLDPENNTLETITDLLIEEDQQQIVRDQNIGEVVSLYDYPATDRVTRTLEPFIIHASDQEADTAELAYMNKHGMSTLVILPLAVKGEAIGIIELESWGEEREYTQSDINLALTLANQAAVALDNARLYEEQIEITDQLRELDKLKSQFLANMSHELRTPLNSIIGFSRVIMKGIDGPVTEEQTQDLSAIYNAGQHLLNMINDILDISKIEAGKMELAFEDIQLPQIIESVLSTARGLVKGKPVELLTDVPDDLPTIHADPTRVRQILLNLLSNACKFTDEGNITITVKQQIGLNDRAEIYIGVTDTGVGISPEDQRGLFEPFTQVDGSATRKSGGTGLGLSITRLLVNLHGGEIHIDSTRGEGSTFYFTIPVKQEGQYTVLAVDGDPQVTELYQRYLSDTAYQIVSVMDPEETLEMAREIQPFVITMDPHLPEHDGWKIFQTLSDDLDTDHILIIICSLKADPEKARSLGAKDYLPKPILKDDFVSALDRISSEDDLVI